MSLFSDRWKMVGARVAAVVVMAISALGFGATAAHAASTWQAFGGLSSKWNCGSPVTTPEYTAYSCTIVSGLYYQGATVLHANTSMDFTGTAHAVRDGYWETYSTCEGFLAGGADWVCFTATQKGATKNYVQGVGQMFYSNDLFFGKTMRLA
ncbi:hypothetical protein ACQPZJ_15960 [Actinoplanes sp. CA-054009]